MNLIIKAVVRIVVVLTAVQGASYFINYISQVLTSSLYAESNKASELAGIGIAFVVLALLLWAVWASAGRIARVLVGHVDVNTLQVNSSTFDAYTVGIALIGVYVFVTALPALFGLVARRIVLAGATTGLTADNDISIWVQTITRLVIGICLTLQGKRILAGIRKVWNEGASEGGDIEPEH
jgi:hypothetical protein